MNLFINTALKQMQIVCFDQKKIIFEINHEGHNDHTTTLYEKIAKLNLELDKLKKIYVVNTPGSYTGLRVGVIFAKTLAMELNLEVYEVNLIKALNLVNDYPVVIDVKGSKYINNDLQLITQIEENTLIDPFLDFSKLIKTNYLNSLVSKNYLEVDIDYIKPAV